MIWLQLNLQACVFISEFLANCLRTYLHKNVFLKFKVNVVGGHKFHSAWIVNMHEEYGRVKLNASLVLLLDGKHSKSKKKYKLA